MTITLELPLKTLRSFANAVDAITPEARLHVEADGLRIISIDRDNAAFVDAKLPHTPKVSGFIRYDLSRYSPEEIKGCVFGLDVGTLKKLLGFAAAWDLPPTAVTLTLKGRNSPGMGVVFNGLGRRRRAYLKALDVNALRKDPDPTQALYDEMPAMATAPGAFLHEAIATAATFGNQIRIDLKTPADQPAALSLEAVPDDGSGHTVTFEIPEPAPLSGALRWKRAKARSLFSINYLTEMARKGSPLAEADLVEIHLGIDHPVRFEFDIAHVGHVTYALAPRIKVD